MRFSLSLPPLVVLLLLAFLWLILSVLLVWFVGPWRSSYERRSNRAADEPDVKARGSRGSQGSNRGAAPKPDAGRARTAQAPPTPPQTSPQTSRVRVVDSAERNPEPDQPQPSPEGDLKDAFDDFIRPETRRDDLDF